MHRMRKNYSFLVPVIASAVLILFMAGCENQQEAQKATEQENKTIAARLLEEIWNQRKVDLVDEIDAADFVLHMAGSPDIIGPEGHKALITTFLSAFPDHRYAVEDQIAEGDKVVTRWTASGTHKGVLMGVAPTGAKMTVTGVSIFCIADGKVVEEWSNWDVLGMWQQLGVDPPMGQDVEAEAGAEAGEG